MIWQNTIPPYITVTTLSDEEIIQWIKSWLRRELASCDWTQLADVNLANKSDWTAYRQALRDLPQQGDDPKTWVFPVPPT